MTTDKKIAVLMEKLLAVSRQYISDISVDGPRRNMQYMGRELKGISEGLTGGTPAVTVTRVTAPGAYELIREAEKAEEAMNRILAKLGVRKWKVEPVTNQSALPPRLVAIMAQLARTPGGLLVPDISIETGRLYNKFYGPDMIYKAVTDLEKLHYVHRGGVPRRSEVLPWPSKLTGSADGDGNVGLRAGDRPLHLTPIGEDSLEKGLLGAGFQSFRTAFIGLPTEHQRELGELLGEIVYQRGAAPDTLHWNSVEVYANIGVADQMATVNSRSGGEMTSVIAAEITTLYQNGGEMPRSGLVKIFGAKLRPMQRRSVEKFGLTYRPEGQQLMVGINDVGRRCAEELLANPNDPVGFKVTPFLAAVTRLDEHKARRLAELLTELEDAIPAIPA